MNVLIIMADELQAPALGCAGHPWAITPNIDRLAARGVRYRRAWTPSPICVPARAAFATGRWIHQTGHWDSTVGYRGAPDGWATAARAAGASTASIGKLHHQHDRFDDGFDERIEPMFLAGDIGWVQALPRDTPRPFAEASELAADIGVGHTSYTRYDRRIADAAVSWLEGRRSQDGPWVTFVSFVAPHYPLSAPEWAHRRVEELDITAPTVRRRVEHPAVEAMAAYLNYGDHFDGDQVIAGRRAYFALVTWLDSLVGEVLDALDRSGAGADTVVVFTSDHGEMLGERGLWCKSFMFDDSVGVPMIVAKPQSPEGAEQLGTVSDVAVNLVDLAPTIAEAVGFEPDPTWVGLSILDPDRLPVDRVGFSEYHDGGSTTGSFTIEHGRWKYVHHQGYRPELYDRHDDPLELVDLAASEPPVAVLAECEEILRTFVDPDAADAQAFADQRALVDRLGGVDAIASAFSFNHTPAPGEDDG